MPHNFPSRKPSNRKLDSLIKDARLWMTFLMYVYITSGGKFNGAVDVKFVLRFINGHEKVRFVCEFDGTAV